MTKTEVKVERYTGPAGEGGGGVTATVSTAVAVAKSKQIQSLRGRPLSWTESDLADLTKTMQTIITREL